VFLKDRIMKNKEYSWARDMAQAVEDLPNRCKVLSSNSSMTKNIPSNSAITL
jgi:hypothetical protein